MPIKITRPTALLVEGKDDKAFFEGLTELLKLQDKIQTFPLEGKEKLEANLKGLVPDADAEEISIKSIGIVADADDDPNRAFEYV